MDLFENVDRVRRLKSNIIRHSEYVQVMDRIAYSHQLAKTSRAATCFTLVGEPGVGKSTLLEHYAKSYPRIEEAERTCVPALLVEIPPSPSLVAVAKAFLNEYDPVYSKSRLSIGEAINQIIRLIKETGTEIILIDELQNFVTLAGRERKAALCSFIKTLMNNTHVAIVAAGVPACLELMRIDGQLRSRMSAEVWLRPFTIEKRESFDLFRKTLVALEKILDFPERSGLPDARLAERLYYATDGRFRPLVNIMTHAVIIAERESQPCITQETLYLAFRKTFKSDTADVGNPFSETFIPHRLIGPGEPHEPGEQ